LAKKRKQAYRGPHLHNFANPRLKHRGPNGWYLCRVCGTEVKPPKQTFCSKECVARWKWQTRPAIRRRAVYNRDRGICSCCGLDTKTIKVGYARQHWSLPKERKSVWDVDHILPLKLGGSHELENLQTLCYLCHKSKTKEDDMPAITEMKRTRSKRQRLKDLKKMRRPK